EDGIRDFHVTGVQTCALPIFVFDSLNWVENMRVAMDAVIEAGKVCEGTICYTGDLLNPERSKYDLKYYVDRAQELKDAGAHILRSEERRVGKECKYRAWPAQH